MKASIVPQLIRKDLRLMKKPMLLWWLGGLATVATTLLTGGQFFLFGMIVFVTCLAGAGMHSAIQTVVEERRDQALIFIMSLPVNVREYTIAKLAANLALFASAWFTLSAASLLIFLGPEGMDNGKLPFVTIVLVGIFVAYTIVLATSLITESMGASITATVAANVVTQLFLWWVVELEGISSVIGGDTAVWTPTAVTVLVAQVSVIATLIGMTYLLQSRKTDFA